MTIEHDRVSETPTIKESTWEALAVATAVLLIFGMFVAAGWIIFAEDIDLAQKRTAIAAAFVTAGAAVVTFCTVVWRGKINAMQVQVAQEQLKALEKANIAALLQKGAELLSQNEKQAQVAAGIASLEILIRDGERAFALASMNLLADYLQEHHENGHGAPNAGAAVEALNIGAKRGFVSDRRLGFEEIPQDIKGYRQPRWHFVSGVEFVLYTGGRIRGEQFKDADKKTYFFHGVTIEDAEIYDINPFRLFNTFKRCRIREFTLRDLQLCDFDGCNFSGSRCIEGNPLAEPSAFSHLRQKLNWFHPDDPPVGPNGEVLSSLFCSGEPPPEALRD